VQFFEVDGLLVRRWVPAGRRKGLEVWDGEHWATFGDVDQLLRHGVRLSEDSALALFHAVCDRKDGARHFSDDEGRRMLGNRLAGTAPRRT
jgi:hypothetical protein